MRLIFFLCVWNIFLQVLHSPFDDIVPRAITNIKKEKEKEDGKKFQSKATK